MKNIEDYKDIFEPFERLIDIEICGKQVQVPENNPLLRCFQYLNLDKISLGEFCWNGSCANCQVFLQTGDHGEKPVLSCRTNVFENLKITKVADEIARNLEIDLEIDID